MQQQEWRGNIRELKNVIERIAIMADSDTVTGQDAAPFMSHAHNAHPQKTAAPELHGRSLRDVMNSYEEAILLREYERCNGNVSRVAANLKIDRANLHRKLKMLGIK